MTNCVLRWTRAPVPQFGYVAVSNAHSGREITVDVKGVVRDAL
jgi:hypothetical protein